MKTILFFDNTAWGLYNFRSTVIKHYIEKGYKIIVGTPLDEIYFSKFKKLGCTTFPINLDSRGINPMSDIRLLYQYYKLIKRIRPNLLISYTIKPNIYEGLAASLLKIPYIPIVPGAGTAFQKQNFVTKIVETLYKNAFKKAIKVFFLNEEDYTLFINRKLVNTAAAHRLNGEGINLSDFKIIKKEEATPFTFILVARLLKSKGIIFYHDAAKIIKEKYPNTNFLLLGMLAQNNSDAIEQQQLDKWNEEGVISYLGATSDVMSFLKKTDCLVLPSYYREGIPRSLMEGAAVGLPLITTNHIGCREVVQDNYNGFLCKTKDVDSLAQQMEKMILMTPEERRTMGLNGRKLVEKKFDINLIIQEYDNVINNIQ